MKSVPGLLSHGEGACDLTVRLPKALYQRIKQVPDHARWLAQVIASQLPGESNSVSSSVSVAQPQGSRHEDV